jgi:hypothetical protein
MKALAHPVDMRIVARANSALLLSLVCGGLAVCAFGAIVVDLSHWFAE